MPADEEEIRDVLLIFLRKLLHHEEHDCIHENAIDLMERLQDGSLDSMCKAILQEMRLTSAEMRH